ncbi:hypothetical protein B296_00022092, partial [Ensete ventricosum]
VGSAKEVDRVKAIRLDSPKGLTALKRLATMAISYPMVLWPKPKCKPVTETKQTGLSHESITLGEKKGDAVGGDADADADAGGNSVWAWLSYALHCPLQGPLYPA